MQIARMIELMHNTSIYNEGMMKKKYCIVFIFTAIFQ
jgi:hypothetical protein